MRTLTLLTLMAASFSTFAADIEIGDVNYGGTGCAAATVQVHENLNGPERLLLPEGFRAQSGGSTGKRLDRKSCMVTIPVSVPPGYSVALESQAIGSQRTARGAQNTLSQELFLAGSVGARTTKAFTPGTSGRFMLPPSQSEWSPCGSSVNLRANLSLTTMNTARAQIEGIVFKVLWKQCL